MFNLNELYDYNRLKNELYDYKHLKVDNIKNAFLSGDYDLQTDTEDETIELLDYIEQHLDKLDTMPKTELADEYGDFEPNYMNDNYDIYLAFDTADLFTVSDLNGYKNDCLKLVQLLSNKYDILKYHVEDNYYIDHYYVRFAIYLKCN